MLRITASASAAGAKQYFGEGLSRSDYYIDGQEMPGRWGGKGAARLGLVGEVDQASYFALCDNRDPATGKRLTPRDKETRRVGYDFTFSCPKGVSVLYALSGDERILSAFRESAEETMREIEAGMKTRVRGGGADEDRVTSEMTWAEFVHFTARPVNGIPSPHLHAHLFVFNATWDSEEGRWKAGQFGDAKRDASYYESAFDARFAKRLNAMGYATRPSAYSFELAGMPQSVIDRFSERRNAVEREAAARGIGSAEGKHAITRRGREKKTRGLGVEELRREWDARLLPEERTALLDVMDGRVQKPLAVTPAHAMDHAIAHVFERHSAYDEKRLRAEALKFGVGSVLPEEIKEAAARPGVIRVERDGRTMVTTERAVEGERRMLAFARVGRGVCKPLGDPSHLGDGLNAEQGAAAAQMLMSRDRVIALRGAAGTGKTHLMKATVSAIERSGTRVVTLAPSAQAARGVLRGEGFKAADTLERFLRDDGMQKQARGQAIWVDEAGLISGRDMQRLFDVAKENGNRVILSGDHRQHASVAATDAFRLLESEAGLRFSTLRKNRRQRHDEYRRAVEVISEGTAQGAREGFALLDRAGVIVEAPGPARHAALVNDYLHTTKGSKTALIIAPTHAEGERLTDELRAKLKERGLLGTRERGVIVRRAAGWTQAQKQDARRYEPGLVVEFHQNAPGFTRGEAALVIAAQDGQVSLLRQNGTQAVLPSCADRFEVYRMGELRIAKGDRLRITKNAYLKSDGQTKRLSNGDVVTVAGFTRDGGLRLTDGKVLPATFGHLARGFTDTSFAAQGKTADHVFIAAGDVSLPAMNTQQWYVSVSRGRDSVKVYVDSKAEARDALARSAGRISAVELVKPRVSQPVHGHGGHAPRRALEHSREVSHER